MKIIFIVTIIAFQAILAEGLHFQLDNEKNWIAKNNIRLSCNKECIHADIDVSHFDFGWFRSPIPSCDYRKIKGFTGRIRLVGGSSARIKANVVLFRENIYYHQQTITRLSGSNNQWYEFFLPINRFEPIDGSISHLKTNELADGDNLQIIVERLQDAVAIELDSLRVVLETDSQEELRRLARLNLRNRLLANPTTAHPKILLKGDFLEGVRAKATAGGLEQIGYETLIGWADSYMQNVDENQPLKAVFAFRNNSEINFQKNRGDFERLLRQPLWKSCPPSD